MKVLLSRKNNDGGDRVSALTDDDNVFEFDKPSKPKIVSRKINSTTQNNNPKELTIYSEAPLIIDDPIIPSLSGVKLEAPEYDPSVYRKYHKKGLLRFLQYIRLGMTQRDSAILMGWKEADINYLVEKNKFNLTSCIEVAKQEFKLFHVMRVTTGDYGCKGSEWLLERKHREEYGKEIKINPGQNTEKQIIKFGDREIEF